MIIGQMTSVSIQFLILDCGEPILIPFSQLVSNDVYVSDYSSTLQLCIEYVDFNGSLDIINIDYVNETFQVLPDWSQSGDYINAFIDYKPVLLLEDGTQFEYGPPANLRIEIRRCVENTICNEDYNDCNLICNNTIDYDFTDDDFLYNFDAFNQDLFQSISGWQTAYGTPDYMQGDDLFSVSGFNAFSSSPFPTGSIGIFIDNNNVQSPFDQPEYINSEVIEASANFTANQKYLLSLSAVYASHDNALWDPFIGQFDKVSVIACKHEDINWNNSWGLPGFNTVYPQLPSSYQILLEIENLTLDQVYNGIACFEIDDPEYDRILIFGETDNEPVSYFVVDQVDIFKYEFENQSTSLDICQSTNIDIGVTCENDLITYQWTINGNEPVQSGSSAFSLDLQDLIDSGDVSEGDFIQVTQEIINDVGIIYEYDAGLGNCSENIFTVNIIDSCNDDCVTNIGYEIGQTFCNGANAVFTENINPVIDVQTWLPSFEFEIGSLPYQVNPDLTVNDFAINADNSFDLDLTYSGCEPIYGAIDIPIYCATNNQDIAELTFYVWLLPSIELELDLNQDFCNSQTITATYFNPLNPNCTNLPDESNFVFGDEIEIGSPELNCPNSLIPGTYLESIPYPEIESVAINCHEDISTPNNPNFSCTLTDCCPSSNAEFYLQFSDDNVFCNGENILVCLFSNEEYVGQELEVQVISGQTPQIIGDQICIDFGFSENLDCSIMSQVINIAATVACDNQPLGLLVFNDFAFILPNQPPVILSSNPLSCEVSESDFVINDTCIEGAITYESGDECNNQQASIQYGLSNSFLGNFNGSIDNLILELTTCWGDVITIDTDLNINQSFDCFNESGCCPDVGTNIPDPLCNGNDAATLDLFSLVPATTEAGTWSITMQPSGGTATLNNNTFDATGSVAGNYEVTYVLNTPVEGCSESSMQTIVVNGVVEAGTGSSISACNSIGSGLINLNDLITGADVGGVWSVSSGNPTNGSFDAVAGTFNTNGQASGNYVFQYEVIGVAPCVNDQTTVAILVIENPGTPVITSPLEYCISDNAGQLEATGNGLIQWYDQDPSLPNVSPVPAPTPNTTVSNTNTYWVNSVIEGCYSETLEIEVVVQGCCPSVANVYYLEGDMPNPLPSDFANWQLIEDEGNFEINGCAGDAYQICVELDAALVGSEAVFWNGGEYVFDPLTAINTTSICFGSQFSDNPFFTNCEPKKLTLDLIVECDETEIHTQGITTFLYPELALNIVSLPDCGGNNLFVNVIAGQGVCNPVPIEVVGTAGVCPDITSTSNVFDLVYLGEDFCGDGVFTQDDLTGGVYPVEECECDPPVLCPEVIDVSPICSGIDPEICFTLDNPLPNGATFTYDGQTIIGTPFTGTEICMTLNGNYNARGCNPSVRRDFYTINCGTPDSTPFGLTVYPNYTFDIISPLTCEDGGTYAVFSGRRRCETFHSHVEECESPSLDFSFENPYYNDQLPCTGPSAFTSNDLPVTPVVPHCPACCDDCDATCDCDEGVNFEINEPQGYIVNNNQTWTPFNNGFEYDNGNSIPPLVAFQGITIANEITLTGFGTLVINNMDFEFGLNGKLIIGPDLDVTFNNCEFVSAGQCVWNGIRVVNDASCHLNNCEVRDAVVGLAEGNLLYDDINTFDQEITFSDYALTNNGSLNVNVGLFDNVANPSSSYQFTIHNPSPKNVSANGTDFHDCVIGILGASHQFGFNDPIQSCNFIFNEYNYPAICLENFNNYNVGIQYYNARIGAVGINIASGAFQIWGNHFDNQQFGIQLFSTARTEIVNNIMDNCEVGIHISGNTQNANPNDNNNSTTSITHYIHGNTVSNAIVGMHLSTAFADLCGNQILGDGDMTNNDTDQNFVGLLIEGADFIFSDNTIDDYVYGSMVASCSNDVNQFNFNTTLNTRNAMLLLGDNGLEIECNTYQGYQTDAWRMDSYTPSWGGGPNAFNMPVQGDCISAINPNPLLPAYNEFNNTLNVTEDFELLNGTLGYRTYPLGLPYGNYTPQFDPMNTNLNVFNCLANPAYNNIDPCGDQDICVPYNPGDIIGGGDGGDKCSIPNFYIAGLDGRKRDRALSQKVKCLLANGDFAQAESVLSAFSQLRAAKRLAVEHYFGKGHFVATRQWLNSITIETMEDWRFRLYYIVMLRINGSKRGEPVYHKRFKRVFNSIARGGSHTSFKAQQVLMDSYGEYFPSYIPLYNDGAIEANKSSNSNEWVITTDLVALYPNPASNYLTVNINGNLLEEVKLELYDLMGEKTGEWIIESNRQQLDISALQAGIYTYRFFTQSGQLKSGKLVVVK